MTARESTRIAAENDTAYQKKFREHRNGELVIPTLLISRTIPSLVSTANTATQKYFQPKPYVALKDSILLAKANFEFSSTVKAMSSGFATPQRKEYELNTSQNPGWKSLFASYSVA